ncbi:uncharacterized protein TNCV_4158051 [Trichonephila clavipes]|nr:uncharacterized protein TNCV_4158051 [Trichonephila clavipes]
MYRLMLFYIAICDPSLAIVQQCILLQVAPNLKNNSKDKNVHGKPDKDIVIEELISIIDSSIKEFSVRLSQFKELYEALKFIMYPDVTLFDKPNLFQFDSLEIE